MVRDLQKIILNKLDSPVLIFTISFGLMVISIGVYDPKRIYALSTPLIIVFLAGISTTILLQILSKNKEASQETATAITCELIEGNTKISAEMSQTVSSAVKYIYAIGGKSKDPIYLEAIESRVRKRDVHYVRVITGDHIHHSLCEHLNVLIDIADLGYMKKEIFGGVTVTHDTVFVALPSPSPNASMLNKVLRITNEQIAAEYRAYVIEVFSASEKTVDPSFIKQLCDTCRSK